ncbi:MAG: hypothetical protein ACK4UO_08905 [Pseudolabrys sp.]
MSDNRGHSPTLKKPMEKKSEKERERIEKQEDEVVVSSDESFPASDPPSFNPGVTGPNDMKKRPGK